MRFSQHAFRFAFKAMGSPCELQLYAGDGIHANAVAVRAREEIERLEQRYSRYRSDSYLSEVNRIAAAGGTVRVDAEMASFLDYADTCHRESDGLFDITSGVLRGVWRFDRAELPTEEAIAALLPRVGWHRVRWRRPDITFAPGMELDLGGIVKEYAADRVATLCIEDGCESGFINLGGDIRVLGPHPDGTPWTIGIKHPRLVDDIAVQSIQLQRGAITTSGDYERCLLVNGRRYGHVLNPRTGWPVEHLASVSVVAELCVVAGSASTIALLKERQGAAWLSQLGLPYLWIDTEGRSGGPLRRSHD